ncbi:hypothetical protein AB685_08400 [Bacillus sp. LL01]|uniref:GNAT family N-acetyltransferase n=1 Tax=Bacillus sp. LL01 TaxID=1665556 RepID=UPI00064D2E9C|nr:GNAT family N-acetyltransferase [Bacillus sp. LL01]KMJ59076.1 hypothetical protein AB685_08400 [Bacillus sp. LL01]
MDSLKIHQVDASNWREIIALQVTESQRKFIEKNEISLLESLYDTRHNWQCYGLFQGTTAVGFVMIGAENKGERYIWLDRFMIDCRYQRMGLGAAFLVKVKEFTASNFEIDEIVLSVTKDNPGAKAFNERHGFVNTGLVDQEFDEEIFAYKLDGYRG